MSVPDANVTRAPRELHMELMDTRSLDVWLCQAPLSLEAFKAFRPEPPFVKSGLAAAAMDAAWFLRSPGAPIDGALDLRAIGGRDFVRVARPLNFRGLAPGDAPTRVEVDKHHVLVFRSGREVSLAKVGGQWFVQQTVRSGGEPIAPPPEWEMTTVKLTQDWQVTLPNPATVYFFRNLDSYAGPVPMPSASD